MILDANKFTNQFWDSVCYFETVSDFEKALNKYFCCLYPREQQVLKMRLPVDGNKIKTYKEIGLSFDISGGRVRDVFRGAVSKLYRMNYSHKKIQTIKKEKPGFKKEFLETIDFLDEATNEVIILIERARNEIKENVNLIFNLFDMDSEEEEVCDKKQ